MFYHQRTNKYVSEGVGFELLQLVKIDVPATIGPDPEDPGVLIEISPATFREEEQAIQYPANWLNLSTPEEKQAHGLVEVLKVGERKDERLFINHEALDGGVLTITNEPRDAQEVLAAKAKALLSQIEAFYDEKAQERRYDNRYTCAMRAGYPGPYQEEGQAFGIWMDTCNDICYELLSDVQGGAPEPTLEEIMASFPELVWP